MFRYQIEHPGPVTSYTPYRDDPGLAYRDLQDATGSCQATPYHAGMNYPYSVDVAKAGELVAVAWLEEEGEGEGV